MIGKHFFKMLIGLVLMGMIGLAGLFLIENYLNKKKGIIKELVLGFPMNPSGDFTDQYVRKVLGEKEFTLASLGRGLSTGTELEYSDPETIKNALKNRA